MTFIILTFKIIDISRELNQTNVRFFRLRGKITHPLYVNTFVKTAVMWWWLCNGSATPFLCIFCCRLFRVFVQFLYTWCTWMWMRGHSFSEWFPVQSPIKGTIIVSHVRSSRPKTFRKTYILNERPMYPDVLPELFFTDKCLAEKFVIEQFFTKGFYQTHSRQSTRV